MIELPEEIALVDMMLSFSSHSARTEESTRGSSTLPFLQAGKTFAVNDIDLEAMQAWL
jgi:hypothetical protein